LRVQLQIDREFLSHSTLCPLMHEVFCATASRNLSEQGPRTVLEFGSMIEATRAVAQQASAHFLNDPCIADMIRSCEARFLYGQFVSRKNRLPASAMLDMLDMLQHHIGLYRYAKSTLVTDDFKNADVFSIVPTIICSFLGRESNQQKSLRYEAIGYIELFDSYAKALSFLSHDNATDTAQSRLCPDNCSLNHEGHGLCRVCKQPWCMHVRHLCQSHLHTGKRGQWLLKSGVRASVGASEGGFDFEPSEIGASASLIERISASSSQDNAHCLLSLDLDQYWQSDGSQGTHWICLQLKADVVADQVGIVVDTEDDSYCQDFGTVRVVFGVNNNAHLISDNISLQLHAYPMRSLASTRLPVLIQIRSQQSGLSRTFIRGCSNSIDKSLRFSNFFCIK